MHTKNLKVLTHETSLSLIASPAPRLRPSLPLSPRPAPIVIALPFLLQKLALQAKPRTFDMIIWHCLETNRNHDFNFTKIIKLKISAVLQASILY